MPKVVAGYKEEARKTILETASTVFAQKGYRDATMDDIAKELGVSKGAVYQYFDSKDQLFKELCGVAANLVAERLREAFSGPDLRKAAEGYINTELDKFEKKGIVMFEAISQAPRDKTIAELVGNNYKTVLGVMTKFLEVLQRQGRLKKEMDAAAAAELMIALRQGVLANYLVGVSRENATRIWMNAFDSILGPYIIKAKGRN